MSIRKINLVEGEFYHIYNRGNSKQIIFQDDKDYKYFIKLLYISNSTDNFKIQNLPNDIFTIERNTKNVYIGAYCLMSNHFHLLMTQAREGGISKFMQKLTTGYSMYYNKKYKRTGSLFEGKFKSQHAGEDYYLKYLFSYIHLNPIKLIQSDWKEKGIKDKNRAFNFLEKYNYSSYLDFLNIKREENALLDIKFFPNYFKTSSGFKRELLEWLTYRQDL